MASSASIIYFWTYAIHGLHNTVPDGFRIPFAAGHVRRMPRLTAVPFQYKVYADRYLDAAKRYAHKPLKQTVISSSALSLMYPAEDIPGYSRQEFVDDLLGEHELEIRRCFESAAPIRDANGKIAGVVMVFHDVTRQRQVEFALRESNQLLSETLDHLEKRVQGRTEELNAANEDLRDLSTCLLRTQDDEHKRLARELHDSVGQILAALSMNIDLAQSQAHKLDAQGARAVAENAQLVEQASKEIRTISHLLHPPLLEIAGLASALNWYVGGFSERSKIKVDLEIPSDFGRLPNDTELAIFRIIQECLTNIHRHSGSDTAAIRIHHEDSHLVVRVLDRGRGISREKQRELKASGHTGAGFAGMRERLRHLGGTLQIQSDEKGTVVSASFKLE